jgi:hypothetical protein
MEVSEMEELTPNTWSISTCGAEIIRLTAVISEHVNAIRSSTVSDFVINMDPECKTELESDISKMFLYLNSISSILSCAEKNIVTITAAAESKKSCYLTFEDKQFLIEPTDILYTDRELLKKYKYIYMINRHEILNSLSVLNGYELVVKTMHRKKTFTYERCRSYQGSLDQVRLKLNSDISLLRPVFDTTIPFDKRRELFESSFKRFLQLDSSD